MSIVNDQLKHELYLNRLATDMLEKKIFPSFDEAYKAVRAILNEEEEIRSIGQLNRITRAINELLQEQLTDGWQQATDELTELAVYESEYYANLIGVPNIPPATTIQDFVQAALLTLGEGDRVKVGAWAEFVRQNVDSMAEQYNNIIRAGYVQGATIGQIKKTLKQFNDGLAKQHAEALARTGALHYANSARDAMAQANKDVIKRRFFLAIFDNRTTLGCRSLHGRTWEIDDDTYVRVPRHINCRSTYLFLLGDQMEPEGFMPAIGSGDKYPDDAEKKPTYKGRKDIGKFDIERIAADTTPDEWLRGQSEAFLVDSLGATRAKLFMAGGLKIERMSDAFGNPLTLDQLRQRDAAAFERAGL